MAPIVASVPGFADPADLTFGAGALRVHVGRFGLAGGVPFVVRRIDQMDHAT